MRRVAITGVSGYIGSQLLGVLAGHPEVETLIGIDLRPPREQPRKLRLYIRDITAPLADVFTREQVDTVVHLAFVVGPTHNQRAARRVNIEGSRNVMTAALACGAKHVLYLSSTAAYGAHPDNPVPLTEQSPLRPNQGFQYSRDKAATDHLFQEFAASHPDIVVTIVRGAVVLGPGGAKAIGAKVFQRVMVRIAGHDPPVQYLHEEDLVNLLLTALEGRTGGVYNAAADGTVLYSEVARIAGRPMVTLSRLLLAGLMNTSWALRLQSQSHSAGLDFIAYPWVASNERFKETARFAYRYSTEDVIRSHLAARRR